MTTFEARIERILAEFGITRDMLACPMQEETQSLVSLGEDCFGREQFARAETAHAWEAMREAAESDGVALQIVSAYRSVDYQCQLIQRKLDRGERIEDIIKVNAAPGFSEHHTGRALDLGTPGCEVLTEVFETTDAFRWLTENAARFGFTLSYPRDNPFGIHYEPWHWAWQGQQG